MKERKKNKSKIKVREKVGDEEREKGDPIINEHSISILR